MALGGRGGGSRNPANQPREVQVSKKISWLLRHGAGSEGLKLGKGGYVNVQDAVSLRQVMTTIYTFFACPNEPENTHMRSNFWTSCKTI